MRLDDKDLTTLRNRLPRGAQAKIAERLKKKRRSWSKQTISDALYGKIYNLAVIEEALLVAEEHEAKMKELLQRINANKKIAA